MYVPDDVLTLAETSASDNFKIYIKSDPDEQKIKQTCIHFYLARYTIEMLDIQTTNRVDLRELLAIQNGTKDIWVLGDNFDFCMSSCGIDGHELAVKSKNRHKGLV
jgi:hypothetical protein